MSKVQDRKKLRQQYLRKKIKACAVVGVAGLACVPLAFVSMVLFVSALCIFILYLGDPGSNQYGMPIFALGMLVISGICGLLARNSWRKVERSQQALARLSYVPPVTVDTLPSDEVLVRGSEQPQVTQSVGLLRAVQPGQEAPQEELLRAVTKR